MDSAWRAAIIVSVASSAVDAYIMQLCMPSSARAPLITLLTRRMSPTNLLPRFLSTGIVAVQFLVLRTLRRLRIHGSCTEKLLLLTNI
jgi:hypothetical protein